MCARRTISPCHRPLLFGAEELISITRSAAARFAGSDIDACTSSARPAASAAFHLLLHRLPLFSHCSWPLVRGLRWRSCVRKSELLLHETHLIKPAGTTFPCCGEEYLSRDTRDSVLFLRSNIISGTKIRRLILGSLRKRIIRVQIRFGAISIESRSLEAKPIRDLIRAAAAPDGGAR